MPRKSCYSAWQRKFPAEINIHFLGLKNPDKRTASVSATPVHPDSSFQLAITACFVFIFSYLAARLGGALVLRPEMIWPVWPGCAFLVAVLLLTPRKIWPVVLVAGLAGFALYDVRESLPIRAIGLLLVADSVEILIAALGVNYVFGGVPCLNSVKSLAKYSLFAVILAPVSVASVAASALEGDSWWVAFFTEALALLTLTPAILSCVQITLTAGTKPKAHYFEAASMFVGLATLAYFTFEASGSQSRPTLLYSLVPFLLWAAVRFGITGTSNSMVLVAFLAIVGAVHGRGPFTGDTPLNNVLSLQLFLLVAAGSFMVLGAVVEARKVAEQELYESAEAARASEERLRLAQQAASIGTFEWNIQTGVNTWTPELESMYGLPPGGFAGTQTAWENLVHPDDLAEVQQWVDEALTTGRPMTGEWRVVWPDGSVHWIAGRWQVLMNDSGEPLRMVGVNVDVTERKRAEEKLREYEKTVEGAEDMIGVIDREYRFLLANRQYLKMRNLTREQVVGHLVPEIVGAEIFETVIKPKLDECFEGKVVRYETKFSYPTVGKRDLSLSYFPIEGVNGVDRAVCILRDITERKRAEEALQNMSRNLIEAQEQERTRIARELHDDVAQRLAFLAIGIEQVEQNLPDSIPALHTSVAALRKQTREISTDVQTMSHELHSSKLEYLGVVVAMKSFCRELGEQQQVEIGFRNQDVPRSLPPEISLCLFRVLQEALHNAARHSEVRRFEVLLRGDSRAIHLSISDSGRGFDLESAMHGQGLGLISMRERVRLVNGTIKIESKPMSGTTIHVRVPFPAEHLSEKKAV